jgi:hypothetical protein
MIRTRTFKWAHQPTLSPGWLPENAPANFYPGGGFLVAHDTIEHLSNKLDWPHELRTFGAAVYSLSGVSGRDYDSIINDVTGFALADHGMQAPDAPKWATNPLPSEHEDRLLHLRDELNDHIEFTMEHTREVDRTARRMSSLFASRALPWFRMGYRDAMRIWGADNGPTTGLLMDRIRSKVNMDHEAMPPLLGDKLSVTVNTKNFSFDVKRTNADPELSRPERITRAMFEGIRARAIVLDNVLDAILEDA